MISIISVAIGCLHMDVQSNKGEQWLTDSPPLAFILKRNESTAIASDKIHTVSVRHIPSAIKLLKDTPYLRISEHDAKVFTGKEIPRQSGYDFYLVRGVVQHKVNGRFYCDYYDRELEISYSSTGALNYPFEKEPIIIQLPNEPEKVYIACSLMQ